MRRTRFAAVAVASVVAVAWPLAGCDVDEKFARAKKIEEWDELIGGPAALAYPGRDYLLENDQIRAAVQGLGEDPFLDYRDGTTERKTASYSVGPGMFGGSLIDLDLQRHGSQYQAGKGADTFTEISPMVNLLSQGPFYDMAHGEGVDGFDRKFPYALEVCDENHPWYPDCKMSIEIMSDEDLRAAGYENDHGLCAAIRVKGAGASILKVLDLLMDLEVIKPIQITNDYVVCPGERYIHMVTEAVRPEKTQDREDQRVMAPFKGPTSLFDTLIAGMKVDGANTLVGDLLFYGAKVKQFADGVGYDVSRKMYDTFDQGGETISRPLEMSYFGGWSPGVSYVYGHADRDSDGNLGRLLIPIFSGSITTMFTHERRCPERGSAMTRCRDQRRVLWERFITMGEGDLASALEPLYELQQRPYGRIKGHVLDGNDIQPVSDVDVFVITRVEGQACAESHWCRGVVDEPGTYEELVRRNRCFTACASLADDPPEDCEALLQVPDSDCANKVDGECTDCAIGDMECVLDKKRRCLNNDTEGNIAFETQMLTDIGLENPKRNGFFSGAVPVGQYYLVARRGVEQPSTPVPVTVAEGGAEMIDLVLPPTGRLRIEVFGNDGNLMPAKVNIGHCFPECSTQLNDPASGENIDCPAGQTCDATENCRPIAPVQDASACQADERVEGNACVCNAVVPGYPELGDPRLYEKSTELLFLRRGVKTIELAPGGYEVLVNRGPEYTMHREHVTILRDRETRLTARLGRVVDTTGWISGDFHVHSDESYDAHVTRRDRTGQMFCEGVDLLSSSDHDYINDHGPRLEADFQSHLLATQVGLETTTLEYGHWLAFPLMYHALEPEHGAMNWQDKPPAQIHYELRQLGEFGDPMLVSAHPRDGFFGLFDQFGMNPWTLTLKPDMLASTNKVVHPSNWDTDFDGYEIFNSKRYEMIRTPTVREAGLFNMALRDMERREGLSVPDLQTLIRGAGDAVVRQILVRTQAEDDAWHEYGERLRAARDAVTEWELKPDLLPNCDWFGATSCRSDADCTDSASGPLCDLWLGDVPDLGGSPIRIGNCTIACTADGDCSGTGQTCQQGLCRERGEDPCSKIPCPVDDMFSLLNHGFVRTAVGHSDSHTLSKNEGGTPRNWIMSSTDSPANIDRSEITENMKAGKVTTGYGVFVELWVNGEPIGGTTTAAVGEPVSVRVRVQSPPWLDVDRVELYRNGRLIVERGLSLPGASVVDLDQTFSDTPGGDAWYVAIAMGTTGKRLDPAHIAKPLPTLTIGMVTSRAFANIKGIPIDAFYTPGPFEPTIFGIYPYSVTNPVFVDVGGDGWEPPAGHGPGWEIQPDGPGVNPRDQ